MACFSNDSAYSRTREPPGSDLSRELPRIRAPCCFAELLLPFSESLIALNLPRGNRQFSRQYFSNVLREPFQMESHAGALFVLRLLQPSRLFRQQLAEA